jgi:hypothetical protein
MNREEKLSRRFSAYGQKFDIIVGRAVLGPNFSLTLGWLCVE